MRDTLAAAGENASREWQQRSIELMEAQSRHGDALRAGLMEALSSSTGALEARLADAAGVLRSDVSTVRNDLLDAGSKQASSLLDGVSRVQEGIEELKERGLGGWLRRLTRRDAS